VCSRAILVTTDTSGVMTLVESSRPPSPTSTTATSSPRAARSAKAIAVVASKKLASSRSMWGRRNVVHSAKASSPIGTPSTSTRSRTETRWGDVYNPTLSPRARSSVAVNAQVEPLPLLPATWIAGKCRSGWPSTSRSPSVGPRLQSIRFPCRAKRKRQARDLERSLGHLREGQPPLLHPPPARRRQDDGGTPPLDRPPGQPSDLLAHHRPHRAAHEVEVHHGDVERHAVQPAVAGPHPLERTCLLDRRLEALLVVLKVKGIGGPESGVELVPGAFIDEQVDVLLGGNAAMVPAIGAHVQRADEPVLDVDVPALVAFLPGVGWNLQLYPFGGAGLTLFFEPGHSRHSGELEGDNLGGAFPRRQPRPRNSLSELSVARLARLPRNPQRDAHGDRAGEQERAAIRKERQWDAGDRPQIHPHPPVLDDVGEQQGGQT